MFHEGGVTVDILARIEAAEEAFYAKFERGSDEWSELFANGVEFAVNLEGVAGSADLRERVVAWLEWAANQEP